MRCNSLLTIPLLAIITFLPILVVRTQQSGGDTLPNPQEFPEAGANCQRRVKVSPWVGTPGVDWPKTFRCVLSIHTCQGVKTFNSDVRPGGTNMCADYWKVHDALANREICCDQGAPAQKPSPAPEPKPEEKCEPPTSWFDRSSDCEDIKAPELVISGDTATLYMCEFAVFSYTNSAFKSDPLIVVAYKSAFLGQLRGSSSSKVCCDKFREAIRTGKPCDPRQDVDCDGTPNKTDVGENGMPTIDAFRRRAGAPIDVFPDEMDTGELDFQPNRTAQNSTGVGDCPCKWELIKGALNCSRDGKEKHYYKRPGNVRRLGQRCSR